MAKLYPKQVGKNPTIMLKYKIYNYLKLLFKKKTLYADLYAHVLPNTKREEMEKIDIVI